jgi:nicotinate phosphoribosyltransferase
MHAWRVRRILDEGGLENATIFASGNLDEYRLRALVSPDGAPAAPIDGFGVGTALDVSSDAPSLDCAYKLQEYAGRARRKRSEGKATWPGRKQVYRNYDVSSGYMARDIVTLEGEDPPGGEPLIIPVMQSGKRINSGIKLDEMRRRTVASYARLPQSLTAIDASSGYPVEISAPLRALAKQLDADAGA